MQRCFWYFLPLIILISGCSWFSHKPKNPPVSSQNVQLFKVIDDERLQQGGKLLISAFRAGPGIEANSELDKTAFMIIKGFADILGEGKSNFSIIGVDQAEQADFIIEGHMTKMTQSSKLRKWFFIGQKKRELAVEGKMIERSSGKELLIFADAQKSQTKKETHKELGERIGQHVAELLLESTRK